MPKYTTGMSIADRLEFYSKSIKCGCRIWTGALTTAGYGLLSVNNKRFYAHRLAWKEKHGRFPRKLLLHRCDTPACINVDHLFPGTHKDNTQDMIAKGRSKLRPHRGESHGMCKLKKVIVLKIRAAMGTQREIAKRFGITQAHVSLIKRRETWRHLP